MRFLWLLALAGCGSSPRVRVVDDADRPIAGAEVRAVYESFDDPAVLTDAEGVAVLSVSGRPRALDVSAPGRRGHAGSWLDVPERQVTLDRLPKAEASYEFLTTVQGTGRLGSLPEGASVLSTRDADLRWFVEFHVRSVVAGSCPAPVGSSVLYAVHSPELFLGGRRGGDVRVRARRSGEGAHHEVQVTAPWLFSARRRRKLSKVRPERRTPVLIASLRARADILRPRRA